MPKKIKNRRKIRTNRSKAGNRKEFEGFLARAKSLGINPTYEEFERAIQTLAKQKRSAEESRKHRRKSGAASRLPQSPRGRKHRRSVPTAKRELAQ
jgi:hypothetical protein